MSQIYPRGFKYERFHDIKYVSRQCPKYVPKVPNMNNFTSTILVDKVPNMSQIYPKGFKYERVHYSTRKYSSVNARGILSEPHNRPGPARWEERVPSSWLGEGRGGRVPLSWPRGERGGVALSWLGEGRVPCTGQRGGKGGGKDSVLVWRVPSPTPRPKQTYKNVPNVSQICPKGLKYERFHYIDCALYFRGIIE